MYINWRDYEKDSFAARYAKNKPYILEEKISHGPIKTNCKGLCTLKLGGVKGNSTRGLYKLGFRYCCRCELYFKCNDFFCKCCGMALRRKKRNNDDKK